MSRSEELIKAVENANIKGGMDSDRWDTLFLAQIATSLAVIADKLTEEEEGSEE